MCHTVKGAQFQQESDSSLGSRSRVEEDEEYRARRYVPEAWRKAQSVKTVAERTRFDEKAKHKYVLEMSTAQLCDSPVAWRKCLSFSHGLLKELPDRTVHWMSQDHSLDYWVRLQLGIELFRRQEAMPRDLISGVRAHLMTLLPLTDPLLKCTYWVGNGSRVVPAIEPYEGEPGDYPEPYNIPRGRHAPVACPGAYMPVFQPLLHG